MSYLFNIEIRKDEMRNTVMKKVRKGVWRMPRLTEAMKDVISCDKLRLEAHILTRRFPNGETHIW